MSRLPYILLLVGASAILGATTSLPEKEAVARAVFVRLVDASGELGRRPPAFQLTAGKRSGAYCKDGTIVLEEAAYDVCAAMGERTETALASILAHELIHYYADHGGTAGIGLVSTDTAAVAAAAIAQEAEADYRGGFLAHLAGFAVTNVMPEVLEGIYATYGLPPTLAGYPPLAQRKATASTTFRHLQELLTVFTTGNALTALERYGEAASYYDYLLREFPSREVYNNTGVVYARAALPLFQPTTLTYTYPIELDLRSRLPAQTRNTTVDAATRDFYLNQALECFERARLLDPDYTPALLNLASTHALLAHSLREQDPAGFAEVAADRLLEAGIRAREATRLAQEQHASVTPAGGYVVQGILAALGGDSTAAESFFAEAAESPLAETNLHLLRYGTLPSPVPPARPGFTMTEQLGELSVAAASTTAPAQGHAVVIATGAERLTVEQLPSPVPATTLSRHRNGDKELVIFATQADYPGTTALEIAIGSDRSQVIAEYGSPSYTLPTVGGDLLVYTASQLVFTVRDEKVAGWFLYD